MWTLKTNFLLELWVLLPARRRTTRDLRTRAAKCIVDYGIF